MRVSSKFTGFAMLRFAVLKGVCGFGDRLQCLLHAIHYAKSTDRFLVVDWRDDVWTHDPKKHAEYYFSFEGIKTFQLDDFIAYFEEHKNKLSVHPKTWKPKILKTPFRSFLYKKIFKVADGNDPIWEIAKFNTEDFAEDIVVLSGTGERTFSYGDFKHIKPQRWLENELMGEVTSNDFHYREYDVVHLRGGDKSWQGGKHPIGEKHQEYESRWPNQNAYLDEVFKLYNKKISDSSVKPLPVLVLTDSSSLGRAWMERFGVGQMLGDTFNKENGRSGTHELSLERLNSAGITKERLNIEMLRDFNLMLNARFTIHVGKSVFAKMGQKIGESGGSLVRLPLRN